MDTTQSPRRMQFVAQVHTRPGTDMFYAQWIIVSFVAPDHLAISAQEHAGDILRTFDAFEWSIGKRAHEALTKELQEAGFTDVRIEDADGVLSFAQDDD